MKVLKVLFALGAILATGALMAQDAEFSGWMKTIAATNGKMKAAVAAKDTAGATTAAKTLETTFASVETYFKGKGVADAAKMAGDAHTAAMNAGKEAAAGNWDAVATSAAAVGGSCQGCHSVHREKGPNGFQFK